MRQIAGSLPILDGSQEVASFLLALPVSLIEGQGLLAESGELLLSTCVLKLVFNAVSKSLVKGLSKHSIVISGVGHVQIEGDNIFHDTGVVRHLQIMQCALQSHVEVGVPKHQE